MYNIHHQYAELRKLHSALQSDEAILHTDYAENWKCKYATEVQAVNFGASQQQATLHDGV